MSKLKNILKIIGIVLGAVIMIAVAYVLYVFISYKRLDDHLTIPIYNAKNENALACAEPGEEYRILTYNIGFGAYDPQFTFFMDGGKSSWAKSKDSVISMVSGAGDLALSYDPDIVLFQEIDTDATRSYHVNQLGILQNKLADFENSFGLNYNSPFLFYPFYQPHGASKAGIGTFSRFDITGGERRRLPISESFSKLVDLDRCYTINRIPVSNGKELIIINLHLSAYGSSPEVRDGQTNMLRDDLIKEYEAGNYVIAGGDFNHDLKLTEDIQTYSWAHYYDKAKIPEHFTFAIDTLDDETKAALPNTCRDSGVVYDPNTTYTVTLDGFIVSDNISITSYANHPESFSFSDHDPVVMGFILNE